MKTGTRRSLLVGGAALLAALPAYVAWRRRAWVGGLVSGPWVKHHPEFEVVLLDRAGDRMSDGFAVPGLPDGMACFSGEPGQVVLMRNHEIGSERALAAYPDRAAPTAAYDPKAFGGVSRLVVDVATLKVVSSNLALTGTRKNCSGGVSPRGYLTCEEDTTPNHGYVFLVDPNASELRDPVRLDDYGQFRHEGAVVDAATDEAFLTEDEPDGCFYRFIPADRKAPHRGRLQALAVSGKALASECPDESSVSWVDVESRPDEPLRKAAARAGALVFSRGEGVFLQSTDAGPVVHFSCTTGGRAGRGEIYELHVGAGRLVRRYEVSGAGPIDMPDNLWVLPSGHVIVAEDGREPNGVHVVCPSGEVITLCQNLSFGEVSGVTAHGDVLFFNLQQRGLTLAMRGPLSSLST